jgi:RNA polymerase sigma factor (sigma-70 family)
MTANAAADSEGTMPAAGTAVASSAESSGDVLADLYRRHAVGLVRLALLLVGDQATAEDVVQDVFARLQQSARGLRDVDKAAPYLRASVVNGCRSVHRTRRRARLLRVTYELPVWSAEAAAMVGEERREVLAAVARLGGRQREVLVLRYYVGLTDQEIAAALRVSRGTVSSTASRALAVLARELREDS